MIRGLRHAVVDARHAESPLTVTDVPTLARNAFDIAWMPTRLREQSFAEIDAVLATVV